MLTCNHHDGKSSNGGDARLNGSINPRENSPFKSFTASHIVSEASPYKSTSFIGNIGDNKNSGIKAKQRNSIIQSPCRVRLPNGESRSMTIEEMKNKFISYVRTSQMAARLESQFSQTQ